MTLNQNRLFLQSPDTSKNTDEDRYQSTYQDRDPDSLTTRRKNHVKIALDHFLDASKYLFKKVCPSVCPSVYLYVVRLSAHLSMSLRVCP